MIIVQLDSRTSKCKSKEGDEGGEEEADKVENREAVRECADLEAGGGEEGANLVAKDVKEAAGNYQT